MWWCGVTLTLWQYLVLVPAVFVIAGAYASVGLGGGTGYLAVMTLVGVPGATMAPTALLLNLVVTGVALLRFGLAGRMRWSLLLPFLLPAMPAAFVGGSIGADRTAFLILLAVALAAAAAGMFRSARHADEPDREPRRGVLLGVALPSGIAIGLLSGFLGIGGGVFLGPLLLSLRWAGPKRVAAMNSALILVLSAIALSAHGLRGNVVTSVALPLGAAALVGGLLGATLAERKLSPPVLQRVFATIVLVAAVKAGLDVMVG